MAVGGSGREHGWKESAFPDCFAARIGRRAAAEFAGTAFLLAAIVGSGVMGERLAGGNVALALLANSTATGAALIALVLAFGPVSGAHLNPAVTLAEAVGRRLAWRDVPAYAICQVSGAFAGVVAAHAMFGLPVLQAGTRDRSGPGQMLAEAIATLGLILVVGGASRSGRLATAVAVGCYIAAAYWFTSSTSFANPAVTLARSATNTFTGIRPSHVPGFLAAQMLGAGAGAAVRWRERPNA